MRIFVAYGYNPRDQWVEKMVFPIISSFASEVVTGERAYGDAISDLVTARIHTCDALLAFLTRRSPENAGDQETHGGVFGSLRSFFTGRSAVTTAEGETHWWVLQELGIAYEKKLKVIEVREQGVASQGGITQSFQRIEYDEKAREKCLIQIVEAIGALHQGALVRIQLLPQSLAVDDLLPLIKDKGLLCRYIIQRGNKTEEAVDTHITHIKGGLFIDAPRVSRGDLLQVNITHGNKEWSSSFESTDYYLKLARS